MTLPRVRHVSDGALLVEFPDASDEDANRSAVALARGLSSGTAPPDDAVPGARTLFCAFDPGRVSHEELDREIQAASVAPAVAAEVPAGREHVIGVTYGGPDLDAVARRAGLTAEEVCARHAGSDYHVAFLGFAPGFAYLAGLPPELAAVRLSTPRPRVSAGSVAVAGRYSGIYPAESPGGWNLIGRATVRLFDPDRDPPALLAPGDRVRFHRRRADEIEPEAPVFAAPREKGGARAPIFRIVSPGLWSAPVGAPFRGRGASGLPPSGAVDPALLAFGNALLGNPAGAAAVELAVAGPELEALEDSRVAIAGGASGAAIDGRPYPAGVTANLRRGQHLALGAVRLGVRAYLCVAGGFDAPAALDIPSRLSPGDLLFGAHPAMRVESGSEPPAPDFPQDPVVRIVLGPQEDWFADEGVAALLNSPFRVSSTSDRRGIRLEGPRLAFRGESEIPPEGTALGAIQVPGDGQPIVLGPDRPVTGGYLKIATVITADFRLVAQTRPGTSLRFRAVSMADALAARRRMART
ncbi:MAG: 5-oxoprolinase/urea amidolyase family protein [Acidobacteriota bacterium]